MGTWDPVESAYFQKAFNWVGEATKVVTSADAFYAMLRDTPNYVPRRIARQVWEEYQTQTAYRSFREARDPDKPLLRRFFANIESISEHPYNVKVKATSRDPKTGDIIEDFWVLGFDQIPTHTQITEAMIADPLYLSVGIDPETVTMDIDYLYHNNALRW